VSSILAVKLNRGILVVAGLLHSLPGGCQNGYMEQLGVVSIERAVF
jgi:hypothetical protein